MSTGLPNAFLLPRPWMHVRAEAVLEYEPICRGGAAPHVCRYVYRDGGRVFVKGSIAQGNREAIRLPFWHQLVTNCSRE